MRKYSSKNIKAAINIYIVAIEVVLEHVLKRIQVKVLYTTIIVFHTSRGTQTQRINNNIIF